MIRAARQSTGLMRHVWLTMATLAIALKIIIPPGFMAGPATNDLPFALVLCTTQAAMVVSTGDGANSGAGASRVTKDITNILAQMPEVVKALTGMDLNAALQRVSKLGEKGEGDMPADPSSGKK